MLLKFARLPEAIRKAAQEAVARVGQDAVDNAKAVCPVRTGYLRAHIYRQMTFSAAGNTLAECAVIADATHAPYVEYGTSKMMAKPFMRPALSFARAELANVTQRLIEDYIKRL